MPRAVLGFAGGRVAEGGVCHACWIPTRLFVVKVHVVWPLMRRAETLDALVFGAKRGTLRARKPSRLRQRKLFRHLINEWIESFIHA